MALRCAQCGYENADGALYCNLCQALFKKEAAGVLGAPGAPAQTAVSAPPSKLLAETTDPKLLAQLGGTYLGLKLYDAALPYYEKALAIEPSCVEACLGMATVLTALERFEESFPFYDKVLDASPSDERALANKGFALARLNRLQEAASLYDKAIALKPADITLRHHKAKFLSDLGHMDEALGAFDDLIRVQGKNPEWLNEKGVCLKKFRRAAEAAACFDKALALDPKFPLAFYNKALLAQDSGARDQAFELFSRFLHVAPMNMEKHISYVRSQLEKGKPEALQYFLKGQELSKAGKSAEAMAHLEAALAADPWYKYAWNLKGALLAGAGRLEDALKCFQRMGEIDPWETQAFNNQGSCLHRLDRFAEALPCYEKVLERDPKDATAWMNQGLCLVELGRFPEADAALKKSLELEPQEVGAWYTRGKNLVENLRGFTEANQCFLKVLELQPDMVLAWFFRGRAEEGLGRTQSARECYERFLKEADPRFETFIAQARARLSELHAEGASAAAPGRSGLEALGSGAVSATSAAAVAGPYKIGDRIGTKYEIYDILGQGGFGVVYLAYSQEAGQVYALKTFRDDYLDKPQVREMFRQEAKLLVDLDPHPNLVRDYVVEEIAGRLFIAMEYIAPDEQGLNSLEGFLARRPPGPNQVLRWALHICHGMEFLAVSQAGAHRDLKPANILIDRKGTAKIADFGLAGALIKLNCPIGTPTHMPPEQFESAALCDQRSDIYSFGIMLYQMCRQGALPFLAPHPRDGSREESDRFWNEMRALHREATAAPLDSPLSPLISRCLEKAPDKRYQNFAALRLDLEALYKKDDVFGDMPQPPRPQQTQAWEWIDRGISLGVLGREEEALACFDKALEMEPSDAAALTNKGSCLVRLGRHDQALICYDRALVSDPKDRVAWSNKAGCLETLGRLDEARRCIEEALRLEPVSAASWNIKGNILKRSGRWEEALSCYDKALSGDPRDVRALGDKALALIDAGRHELALECLDRAVAVDPRSSTAWCNKGVSLHRMGRFPEALECFHKAVAIKPYDFVSWTNMSDCLQNLRRFDDAVAAAEKALAANPRYAGALNNKGNALNSLKRYEEALPCFNQALEIMPHYAGAWYNKGLSLRALARHEEALASFEKTNEFEPRMSASWYFRGDILKSLKRYKEAVGCWDKTLEFETANQRARSMALYRKGYCLQALGAHDLASPCYASALEINPNYPEAQSALESCRKGEPPPEEASPSAPAAPTSKPQTAAIDPRALELNGAGVDLFKVNKLEEALACFELALGVSPHYGVAWFHKGLVMDELNRPQEAYAAYSKALENNPNISGAWLNKGAKLAAMKKPEEAIVCFDKSLALDPEETIAWFNKGNCLKELGRHSEALAVYEQGLKLDPKHAGLWNNKGTALIGMDKPEEALACFEQVLALNPKHAFGWNNKGEALNKLKRYQEAIPCFAKALEIKTFAAAWCNRGDSLRFLEQHQEALLNYQKAIERYDDYAEAWFGKAECEDRLYLKEEAAASYQRFLALAKPALAQEIARARERLESLAG